VETFDRILNQRDTMARVARRATGGGLSTVYLVGCGGSFLAGLPAYVLLQSRTAAFDVQHLTSAEFIARRPAALGPHSLVIAGSHTGGTKETVAAVELAKQAGAQVFGYASKRDCALSQAVAGDFVSYDSTTTTGDAKQLTMALTAWSLLEATGRPMPDTAQTLYTHLGPALLAVHEQAQDRFAAVAERYHGEPISYVLGAGPGFAAAYNLSMCFFQEMQWMHSAAFHAGEFFHGAFEVVTEDTPVYVLMGEDSTRPVSQRAVDFLTRHTKKLTVLDTADYDLPGVPSEARALATPHVLVTLTGRLAANFAHASGHDLSIRRYMGKVDY
jgi:fructoselysine-6-P-deglycase FrlB-like protein